MKEIAELLSAILNCFADFFEVLDISILLGGIVLGASIIFWHENNDIELVLPYLKEYQLLASIVVFYIFGLLSFAVGRGFRRGLARFSGLGLYRINAKNIQLLIESFKLNNDSNIMLFDLNENSATKEHSASALYAFLWSDLRQNLKYGYSLSFLKKYWSLSMVYDSLIPGLILWIITLLDLSFGIVGRPILAGPFVISCVILLVIAIIFCITSACKYDKYQTDELFASYVALKRN